jgi:hypothetical protein
MNAFHELVSNLRHAAKLLGLINEAKIDDRIEIAESDISRARRSVEDAVSYLENLHCDGRGR